MDPREAQLNQLNAEFTRAKPFRQSPTTDRSKSGGRFAWLGEKRTKRTTNCFMGMGLLGLVIVVAGLFSLVYGRSFFWEIVLRKMSIKPNSERFDSWLKPPVQPYLSAYAFNITNPEEVLNGAKPILQEVGPFVYKSETFKENIRWHDDNTMSYRPRKIYTYQPNMSKFPDEYSHTITVPNIPLWTAINSVKDSDFKWGLVKDLIETTGRGTPFVQVSVGGLLWGYEDDLPCTKLTLPKECHDKSAPFSHSHDDHWGDDHENPFEKKKEHDVVDEVEHAKGKDVPVAKKKAEYVDCKCHWGLFRDRNVTLRHPIRFHTGQGDYNLNRRGWVTNYKGKDHLGWWKEGSTCDAVGGQDGGTLPVGISEDDALDIFIPLMCRRMPMIYEQDIEYDGINTYRFIPPMNALGTPDDQDPDRNNQENSCYCLAKEGFKCFKSGLVNLGACKREDMSPPLALSMPHFYQADPSYLNAVVGLEPNKSKHEFYIDVAPDFGFPLAMRPRFQLNAALFKFSKWAPTSNLTDELVIPFLWAEDGFGKPSPEMVNKIQAGLFIPELLSTLFTVVCLIFGGLMVMASFIFFAVKCPACQAAA